MSTQQNGSRGAVEMSNKSSTEKLNTADVESCLENTTPENRVIILKQEKIKAKTAFTKLTNKLSDILDPESKELPSRSLVKELQAHLNAAQEQVLAIMDRLAKEYKLKNEDLLLQNVDSEIKVVEDLGIVSIQLFKRRNILNPGEMNHQALQVLYLRNWK